MSNQDKIKTIEETEIEYMCPVRGLVKQKVQKVVYKTIKPIFKCRWGEDDQDILQEIADTTYVPDKKEK
jgi:predicted subunit of tRNA(5-methylaminomethyl-2-thiouridylate) methyltransferase